jgi:hypothetical protein
MEVACLSKKLLTSCGLFGVIIQEKKIRNSLLCKLQLFYRLNKIAYAGNAGG